MDTEAERDAQRQQSWAVFKKVTQGMSRSQIDDWMEAKRKPVEAKHAPVPTQPKAPVPSSMISYVYVEDADGVMHRRVCPPPLGLEKLRAECAEKGRRIEVREERRRA